MSTILSPDVHEELSKTDIVRLVETVQGSAPGSNDYNVAFTKITEQFEPVIFAIVLRRLRNRAQAAEITQDVLLQIMRKIQQLREPERFSGWAKQIAVRMAINSAVRDKSGLDGDLTEVCVTLPDHHTHLFRLELTAIVHEIIDDLPELSREIVQHFYIDGSSMKRIAEELDIPEGTVKRRLFTARQLVRDRIQKRYPDYACDPVTEL